MSHSLHEGLKALGLSDEKLEIKLNLYLDELLFWNEKYGLINETDRDVIIIRHIMDSLALVPLLKKKGTIKSLADIGSGAGLPGIPLALALPEMNVSLIEKSGKRARFLENVLFRLNVNNLELINKPVEKVKGTYEIITFRALTPLNDYWLEVFQSILSETGEIIAYKGKSEVLKQEWALCKKSKKIWDLKLIEAHVPSLNAERTWAVLRLF